MTQLKLGKLAPKHPVGLNEFKTYCKALPVPPEAVEVPDVSVWGMMLNDTYGDCTIAGVGHIIVAANAEVDERDAVPDDAEIKAQYFALTGGEDTGCVEADVLHTWYRVGLFTAKDGGVLHDIEDDLVELVRHPKRMSKIAGYAPVSAQNITDIHNAIDLFGHCYVGVQCPQSAQEQFQDGQPWTVVPGSPIIGGHCIVFVGYDSNYLYAVTWGSTAAVSYPWWANYGDESWVVIPQEFVEAGQSATVDIDALRADIDALD
jgi:hypothetical protein